MSNTLEIVQHFGMIKCSSEILTCIPGAGLTSEGPHPSQCQRCHEGAIPLMKVLRCRDSESRWMLRGTEKGLESKPVSRVLVTWRTNNARTNRRSRHTTFLLSGTHEVNPQVSRADPLRINYRILQKTVCTLAFRCARKWLRNKFCVPLGSGNSCDNFLDQWCTRKIANLFNESNSWASTSPD